MKQQGIKCNCHCHLNGTNNYDECRIECVESCPHCSPLQEPREKECTCTQQKMGVGNLQCPVHYSPQPEPREKCGCFHKHKDIDYCHDWLKPSPQPEKTDYSIMYRENGYIKEGKKYVQRIATFSEKEGYRLYRDGVLVYKEI